MDAKKNGTPVGAPNYNNRNNIITTSGASQRIHDEERRARKRFIEDNLREVLKVKHDFEDIKYGRDVRTEQEYMRIRDIFGGHITINISNLELHEILNYACWVVLNGLIGDDGRIAVPEGIVADKQELRKLAPLFKGGR